MHDRINAPMQREEFMHRTHEISKKAGEWVWPWLVGWLQTDLTDQMRGDALAGLEEATSGVLALPHGQSPAGGDSPLAP
jgi:hypothetical protein